MGRVWVLVATMLLMSLAVCLAQPPAVEQPKAGELPKEIQEARDQYIAMGMEEKEATIFAALSTSDVDPMTLFMLMAMQGGGGGMEGIGMMMLMNQGKGGPAQPLWMQDENTLYVLEKGTIFKINIDEMKVEQKLKYKGSTGIGAMLPLIMGMRGQGRPGPQATVEAPPAAVEATARRPQNPQQACVENLKQLLVAFRKYAGKHGDWLPADKWVAALGEYVKDPNILKCPSRPEAAVGYAMNEKLLGVALADVRDPAKTVLLFEANVAAGGTAFGGPANVPEGGTHNGMVNVGFVDGHVETVAPGLLVDLLNAPVVK